MTDSSIAPQDNLTPLRLDQFPHGGCAHAAVVGHMAAGLPGRSVAP